MDPSSSSRAAQNLDLWAEITALAIELRKSLLASQRGQEWAENRVWGEMREAKEREWTNGPS